MSVTLSASAARHINKIGADSAQKLHAVRLEVLGGGCSGYQYKFSFAETIDPAEDVVVEVDGAKLVIDQTSLGIIDGSEVDYGESLMEAGFTVKNPQAASSCGCGSSFSVKE